MKRDRKLDQFLSVLVLMLYVVIIVIKWIMAYNGVSDTAMTAVEIIKTIIQCLMICVVLYNALGWTGNILIKILFIVIALFLIVSSVIIWIPEIGAVFAQWNIPTI